MNRFRKKDNEPEPDGDEPASRSALREFKDDSQATSPSMAWYRFEVTAYWLVPLLIFSAILLGGVFLAFKFDIITLGESDPVERAPYIGPSGDILVPELVKSYFAAVGGLEALEEVRSVRYKGRLVEETGDINLQVLVSAPDKGMIITEPGEAISQRLIVNGDIAWQVSVRGRGERQVTRLDEATTASLAWSLQVHNPFRRLVLKEGAEGFSARKIDFEGRSCYELTKTVPNGSEFLAVLDAESLYLLKSLENKRSDGGLKRLEIIYGDHRKVSPGIVEAFETKTYKDGELYNEVFLEYIEINPGLMSSLFRVPEELSN